MKGEITHINNQIALVDSNKAVVETIQQLLSESTISFKLSTWDSIDELIEHIENKEHRYVCILFGMEGTGADELTAFRRLSRHHPHKNYILLVDEYSENISLRAIASGAQDLLLKKELQVDVLERAIFYGFERNKLLNKVLRIQDKAEQEMIKIQERYQDIFAKSKDAIYVCDLDGHLVDYNEATETLFKLDREALSKIDIHTLMRSPKKRNEFLMFLVGNKKVDDFEIEVERSDGDMRQCVMTARMNQSPEFTGYTGILRDMTEQRQAVAMKKARDLARQSAKLKEQFIASVSHEMRTPMNAILGMSNLVMKTDLTEEQYNYISSIRHSSEILLGVVNDILEISEIQNGKIKFENNDFDLHELLNNLVNVMQYKAQEKGLKLELDQDQYLPKLINGDKLRLNQILYNLVGNAIKFTDKGFVKISVINLNQSGDSVQIKFIVEDTGIGIPKEKIESIFESFTRIRQKDRIYEGTGLGLSIARNLVEQQGGKIGAASVEGKGSKFFFDLIFEMGTEVATKIDAATIQDDLNFDNTIKLLLVEDHKINQMVAKKTLEKQWKNIQITIADNGKIAIELLEKEVFDIILMDIQMPVMDGYETTNYIRNNMRAEVAQIPILAMTAHAHISKDEKFKEYGMNDFVLKPFEPEQLFSKVTQYAHKDKVA